MTAAAADSGGPVLSVTGLAKSYGGARRRRVLDGVDLSLSRGEYVAIMGESGVGKSTLLNLVAGLDVPDGGSVVLDGRQITALDETRRTAVRRAAIGFVFQAFYLLPHLTIAENVALPLALNGVTGAIAAERVQAALDATGIGAAASAYPRQLSGGELQRAAIARAVVHRPLLLLADEPTGNLDADSARQILALLREQVKRGGGAGILVTHSAAAADTADRVLVLSADGLRASRPGAASRDPG